MAGNLTARSCALSRPTSISRAKAPRTGRVLAAAAEPAKADSTSSTVVTIEYQRQQAKAMQKYVAVLISPFRPPSVALAVLSSRVVDSIITVAHSQHQPRCRYLRDQSLEQEIADAQVFGWTRKNELGNGRWVMMGLAIGLLTEYATGVSFIDQLKLMVSYLGVIDLD